MPAEGMPTRKSSLTPDDDDAFYEEATQLRREAVARGLAEGHFKIDGPLASHPPIRECAGRALIMINTAMRLAQNEGDRARVLKLQKNRAAVELMLQG